MWSVLFFVLAICFFAKHIQNPYEYGKAKPTVYCISTTLTQAKPIGQPMTKSRFVDERLPGENPKDAADLNIHCLVNTILDLPMLPQHRKKSCNTNYSIP
jgi:hypothetical protein